MTQTTDYRAMTEVEPAPAVPRTTSGGHGLPSISHKAPTPTSTPPHSGSTDEAALDMLEDDELEILPRGTPRPLPTHFMGVGYGRNSYFAWRLNASALVVTCLGICGIVSFWTSHAVGHGGVYVSDVGHSLSFHRTQISSCDSETGYCGACDTIITYAMLIYHVAPLLLLIGLPASGLRVFEPFCRKRVGVHQDGRQKLQRALFFQFCEVLSVCVLVFNLLVFVYFVYAIFQGNNFHCSRAQAIVYVLGAVATFLITFVVLTYFARFREHLKMQLGAFKETDQTGDIRSRLASRRKKYQSERAKTESDLRKRLYKEASLGNVRKMEDLLKYAKERLGDDFALDMYGDAKLVCQLFGRSKKNPVHMAAYLGNVEALKLLHAANFDVNSYDKVSRVRFTTGDLFWTFAQFVVAKPVTSEDEMAASIFRTTLVTPLHCAVSMGQIDAVEWLLAHGAKVNLKSKASYWSDRMPPLFVADNPDIVALLLEAGANHLEVPDPGHMNTLTVLQMAYLRGNFPVAHELEKWGADVALTPLHEAAADNDEIAIKKLLKGGADPNCVGEYGYAGMHRRTPLHWGAINGHTKAVNLLLDAGADPNFQDIFGRSPLHWAARVNKPEVVRLLLDKGGDVNLLDYHAKTPLLCAASSKNVSVELFECLIEHGADIDARLPNGDTALHIAMKCEQKQTALALLDAGADVMETNRDGYRPVDCTTSTQLQFEIKQAAGDRDVMISYTHTHIEFALKLRDQLERANITSWLDQMDPSGIGGGSVWREEIARGIKNAEVVICLYTEDYPGSEWCLKELALAKQLQKPIIAVSTEGVPVTEDMQVYIYTRQMVPFEPAITKVDKAKRQITYEYDDDKFTSQFRLLLDGVRDEIEKCREANMVRGSRRRAANGTSASAFGSGNIADWDPSALDDVEFAFVSHGDHHHSFVQRLHDRLQDSGIKCYLDGTQAYNDMSERIRAAKDAILKCTVFIVVISSKTVGSELVKDQLAFAEDKGRTILPIMLNDMEVPLDKHYTLSRLELLHFTPEMGFNSSFQQLLGRVRRSMTAGKPAALGAPRAATRPTLRAVARMTALGRARNNGGTAVNAAARAFMGRPRVSTDAVALV